MTRNRRWRLFALVLTLVTCATAVSGEPRTWSDKTGKFSITAELIAVQQGNVVLRQADGQQLTVPVKKLSSADRAFVEGLAAPKTDRGRANKGNELAEIAEQFFTELRSEKRDVAGESLTAKGQELLKGGKSPLATLPAPEEGNRSIRIGRPKLDGKVAEIPVQVKAAGQSHKTKLHFRQEEDQWRICAMSIQSPSGETMIDFEAEVAESGGDPLDALVGKTFDFSGVTLEGNPLDLSRYQGKVVLVEFWATRSEASQREMPNLFANYQKYFKQGFDVIAVSVDEDFDGLSTFVAKAKPPWVVIADLFLGNAQSMAAKYHVQNLPTSILIGKDGKVIAINCHGKKLGEELDKLFGAEGGKVENTDARTPHPPTDAN